IWRLVASPVIQLAKEGAITNGIVVGKSGCDLDMTISAIYVVKKVVFYHTRSLLKKLDKQQCYRLHCWKQLKMRL
ncbi:MAG: hypothetical protein FWG21_01735, partial [Oscillospiraceae bacterium]|nr:hypothetical protein [Oscillospiraceae bacterium]